MNCRKIKFGLKDYADFVKTWILIHLPAYVMKKLTGGGYKRYEDIRYLYYAGKEREKKDGYCAEGVLIQEEIPQFNFWVFNKLVGMMNFFDYKNKDYCINVKAQEEGFNMWSTFFKDSGRKLEEFDFTETSDLGDQTIRNLDEFEFFSLFNRKVITGIYRKYFILSDDFKKYVEEELDQIIGKKKILGVLCRGTDYTRKRPHGHPVQPEVGQVIEDVIELADQNHYKYVYLATDEARTEKMFRERLDGICDVLVNKRQYYDEFYANEVPYISACRHQRDQDRLLTSKEYLSSIILLAHCNELLAGNCGGSRAAVYINGGKYQSVYFYELGCYE